MLYQGNKETSEIHLATYQSYYSYSLDAPPDKLVRRSFKILNILKKCNGKNMS